MIATSFLSIALCSGCIEGPAVSSVISEAAPGINAEIAAATTRTCVNSDEVVEKANLPVMWRPTDLLGVFTDGGSLNVMYVNDEKVDNVTNTSFSTSSSVKGNILYAYYPYGADNDGKSATALVGVVPQEQKMDGNLCGDYKYGVLKSGSSVDAGNTFRFHNIFSMVYFKINPEGTALEGEILESVTLSVTRGGSAVPLTGGFSFSAVDGTYALSEVSNVLNTTWNLPLDGTLSGFATVFSEIRKGDKLNFVFKTANYNANLTVTSSTDFIPGAYYTFPLTLSKFPKLDVKKILKGTFTAATYNVDGLPAIASNSDGPGSSGTKKISQKIATDNWDFVAFSEDFDNHDELMSAMTAYSFGSYRGNVGISQLWGSVADTDGLGFAWRKDDISVANEKYIKFTSAYGGLTGGANECIKKGIRHYEVTITEGVVIDVLITHMNTYSSKSTKYIEAQHAQLTQVAEYVNSIRTNGRPIIFMGDTNCRYTRHDFQTYFWDKLDDDLVAIDPWVTYQWDGEYPTYPSKSLMVSDATGTDPDLDIICENTQKGEVVDKIIYINNPDSDTQINALNYLRDYDGYNGLADHMPIVVEFSYEKSN